MEDDTGALLMTTGTVFAYGMTLGACALPQPVAASAITVGLIGLDLATARPPEPFERVSREWGELSKTLKDFHDDVEELVGKVDKAWEGPGADAFVKYMKEEFLSPLKVLADACETGKKTCDSIAKNFQSGLEFYLDSSCVCMVALLACNGLMAIPKVGWMLAEAAKALVAFGEIGLHINTTVNICNSVKTDVSLSEDLGAAANDLYLAFTEKENKISNKAMKDEYKSIESTSEDPTQWNKE
jgi:hypothetical protein